MTESPPARPVPLTLAMASLVLFAAVAVAVRMGWTQATDVMLLRLVRGIGGAAIRDAVIDLTALGSATILLPAMVGAALLLAARGDRRSAAWLVAVVLGGRIVVELVKDAVARARPPLIGQAVAVHSFSFPSAHAANTTITCLAIAFAAARGEPKAAPRQATLALAAAVALAIGLTRVWLGVHWPSDVIAGWLFGFGWVAAASHLRRA